MSPIVIVSGSPGTGKTTVARHLARSCPRGLHLPSDVFYTFPAHPISPYRPGADEQNQGIMIALARTAIAFAERTYDVFMDGIFGPWFLPHVVAEVRHAKIPLEYVILRASLDTALQRVRNRQGYEMDHVVRQMHAAFSDLGTYQKHAVETDKLEPEAVVAEIIQRRSLGRFLVVPEHIVGAEPLTCP